jgi:hypothetical protein
MWLFDRTTDDRLNPSCALNLQREKIEADLVLWESGEAELSMMAADGSVEQVHFEHF